MVTGSSGIVRDCKQELKMDTEELDEMEPDEYDYFNELERRYLLTLLLTEETGSDELMTRLDGIASRLEDDDEKAEDEFYSFEEEILQKFIKDQGAPPVAFPEIDDPDLDAIERRFHLLFFGMKLLEGEEERKDLVEFIQESIKRLEENLDASIDDVDEKLTLMEDDFISVHFEEDEELSDEEE